MKQNFKTIQPKSKSLIIKKFPNDKLNFFKQKKINFNFSFFNQHFTFMNIFVINGQ